MEKVHGAPSRWLLDGRLRFYGNEVVRNHLILAAGDRSKGWDLILWKGIWSSNLGRWSQDGQHGRLTGRQERRHGRTSPEKGYTELGTSKLDNIFTRMMSVSRWRLLGLLGAQKVTEEGAWWAATVFRLRSWWWVPLVVGQQQKGYGASRRQPTLW
jgi:hypothetical protein